MVSSVKALSGRISSSLSETFAALKYYNYRLWFTGQVVSLVGTWMQSTAQGFFIYQLTKSTAYLGLVGFVAGVPSILFTLYAGVIADRLPRRTLLVITQTVMMLLAFILAALTFTNAVKPWHILVLAFLLGVANAFDAPARNAFVLELVSRADMTNAIALNSTMFNIGTLVGPSVAGLTYAAFGPAWCFTLNGISFIAVIAALLLMRITPVKSLPRRSTAIAELREGFQYVFASRLVLSLIISVGLVSVFANGILTLLPAWSTDVLHGDSTTYGLLISARGFGALICALMIAFLSSRQVRGKMWTAGSFVLPGLLFLFACVRWLPVSLVTMVGIGWGFMMVTNNSNALVQSQVSDELRGRVMGIYVLIFFGGMPLGSLLAGAAAEKLGETMTGVLSAAVMMVFALIAWIFLPAIRREG